MYKGIMEYKVTDFDSLRVLMKRWVEHSKEARGRSKEDLELYDKQWNELIKYIEYIKLFLDGKSNEDYTEEDSMMKDFIEHIRYVGPLYRYHKKNKEQGYEIEYHGHWVSWSKVKHPKGFYIFSKGSELLQIEGVATESDYGIDLNRFYDFFNEYSGLDKTYFLGSPAIIREQEVVFLLNDDYVKAERVIEND